MIHTQKLKLAIGIVLTSPLFLASGVAGMGVAVALAPVALLLGPLISVYGCWDYRVERANLLDADKPLILDKSQSVA